MDHSRNNVSSREDPDVLSIVTFNVLMEFVGHPLVPKWDQRKDACLAALRSADADVIGLQETSPSQLRFLAAGLPEFDVWTYRIQLPADFLAAVRSRSGPDVPAEFAEVALLTRRDTLEVEGHDHWWLSPTPDREFSAGFGNVTPRLAVRARATHRRTRTSLTVATTHIDQRAPLAMTETCIRELAPDLERDRSVIFFGDLNTHTDHRGYDLMLSSGWRDAYQAARPQPGDDETPTFIDDGRKWMSRRIDHVLYHSPRVRAIEWVAVDPTAGSRLSDHFPVVARFALE